MRLLHETKKNSERLINAVMHSFHPAGDKRERSNWTANSGLSRFLQLADLKFRLQGGISDHVVGRELEKSIIKLTDRVQSSKLFFFYSRTCSYIGAKHVLRS